jgi:hypothetical protein
MLNLSADPEVVSVLTTMARVANTDVNSVLRALVGLAQGTPPLQIGTGDGAPNKSTPPPNARSGTEGAPWLAEIHRATPLYRIGEKFADSVRRAVPDTAFGPRTQSGMYVAAPNYVTVKPQPRRQNLRISVYGPFSRESFSALNLQSSRNPYFTFLFDDATPVDQLEKLLAQAYRNRRGR